MGLLDAFKKTPQEWRLAMLAPETVSMVKCYAQIVYGVVMLCIGMLASLTIVLSLIGGRESHGFAFWLAIIGLGGGYVLLREGRFRLASVKAESSVSSGQDKEAVTNLKEVLAILPIWTHPTTILSKELNDHVESAFATKDFRLLTSILKKETLFNIEKLRQIYFRHNHTKGLKELSSFENQLGAYYDRASEFYSTMTDLSNPENLDVQLTLFRGVLKRQAKSLPDL